MARLKSVAGDGTELREQVSVRLAAHSVAEEVNVYLVIERQAKEDVNEVQHGIEEHPEAKELLAEALESTGDAWYPDAVERFV